MLSHEEAAGLVVGSRIRVFEEAGWDSGTVRSVGVLAHRVLLLGSHGSLVDLAAFAVAAASAMLSLLLTPSPLSD